MLVKLNRQPLPSDTQGIEELMKDLELKSRAPYSGYEYGYYTATSSLLQVAVDVICPGVC
jgi:hypothetical protein